MESTPPAASLPALSLDTCPAFIPTPLPLPTPAPPPRRQEAESKAGIKAAAGQYLESFYEVWSRPCVVVRRLAAVVRLCLAALLCTC